LTEAPPVPPAPRVCAEVIRGNSLIDALDGHCDDPWNDDERLLDRIVLPGLRIGR
jgi:hypothetical protein